MKEKFTQSSICIASIGSCFFRGISHLLWFGNASPPCVRMCGGYAVPRSGPWEACLTLRNRWVSFGLCLPFNKSTIYSYWWGIVSLGQGLGKYCIVRNGGSLLMRSVCNWWSAESHSDTLLFIAVKIDSKSVIVASSTILMLVDLMSHLLTNIAMSSMVLEVRVFYNSVQVRFLTNTLQEVALCLPPTAVLGRSLDERPTTKRGPASASYQLKYSTFPRK